MKSAEDVVKELAEETDIYYWGASVKKELAQKIREAIAGGVMEAKQVLRKCWVDADKRSTMAEYHVMVAKRIEKRVEEIKEGK